MRYGIMGAALATMVVMAPAANAATFLPGSPQFQVFGDITSGPVTAYLGNGGIAAGNFTDNFLFRIDQNGVGSGSISTGTSELFDTTDLDIYSVTVNGIAATKTLSADGLTEFFNISGVPILFGQLNNIEIIGFSRGDGSYGGNATFIPAAVPEAATWAMMIAGFGLVGGAVRRSRRNVAVSFG